MIYNFQNKTAIDKAREKLEQSIKREETIELRKIARTRSNLQNRALHLFFTQVAEELNNIGITFVYHGLKGQEMETQWTGELFKKFTWKPIQKTMFGKESTTELTTEMINKIFQVINKFFAERGVEVSFPNQFDYYLKFYGHE